MHVRAFNTKLLEGLELKVFPEGKGTEREQEIEESNWDIQVGQMLRKLGVLFVVVVLNFLFGIRV